MPARSATGQMRRTSSSKIELDDEDDVWAIDDVHASNGNRYDLWLHPDTMAIIAREPHDE
jgi:hypothetical protein